MPVTIRRSEVAVRALGAVRLSRKTDETTSPERQREQISHTVAARGDSLVYIAEDLDVSGAVSPFERPDLGPWLNGKSDQWDILIVAKLDRLTRSTSDLDALVKWCLANGKTLVSVSESIDLATSTGKMFIRFLGMFAEFERERISERRAEAAATLRNRAQFGGGQVPYGYQIEGSKAEGYFLVPHPEQRAVIERMVDQVIAGKSVTSVARSHNSDGTPSQRGGEWKVTTVLRILRSPVINGYVVHEVNGEPQIVRDADGMPVKREPLIDDETWAQLQAALEANSSPGSGVRSNATPLLQVAFCGHCNEPMYFKIRKGRGYGYYECKTRRMGGKCAGRSVRQSVLEDTMSELLLNAIGDRELPRTRVIPAVSHTTELAKLEATIADLDHEFAAGEMPARTYGRMMTRLEERREELAALPQREERTVYEPSGQTVAEHWAELDWEGKSRFLRQWNVRLWVFGEGHEPTIGGVRDIQYLLKSGIETDPEIARAFGLTRNLYASAKDGFGLIA